MKKKNKTKAMRNNSMAVFPREYYERDVCTRFVQDIYCRKNRRKTHHELRVCDYYKSLKVRHKTENVFCIYFSVFVQVKLMRE
jgi:hypothetical protein